MGVPIEVVVPYGAICLVLATIVLGAGLLLAALLLTDLAIARLRPGSCHGRRHATLAHRQSPESTKAAQ